MTNCFKYGDRIGVGVASFERANLLRSAITSVLRQTYTNLDIHVSDNCSSDPDIQIVLRDLSASDSRLRWTVQSKNLGAFANFAYLLDNASTELFIWLADDDEWSPGFLEGLAREHVRRPSGLIYGTAGVFTAGTLPTMQERLDPSTSKSELKPSERFTPPKCAPGSAALEFFPKYFSDVVFYGLFPSASGKRYIHLLKPWLIPAIVKRLLPGVENDLVTFPFILALWVENGAGKSMDSEALHLRRSSRPSDYNPSSNMARIFFIALLHLYIQIAMTKRLFWMVVGSSNVSLLPRMFRTSLKIFQRKFEITRTIRRSKLS